MSRPIAPVAVAAIGLLALAGTWLSAGGPAPRSATAAPGGAGTVDDLLMDLQLVPMDGRAPKPFTLESLDGRQVTLAEVAGRPALLYFWATW